MSVLVKLAKEPLEPDDIDQQKPERRDDSRPVQGGGENTDERVKTLHTEMYEKKELDRKTILHGLMKAETQPRSARPPPWRDKLRIKGESVDANEKNTDGNKEPLNPSLPECTDLLSFKHKYTDEETEETVFHGQCDTQEAHNYETPEANEYEFQSSGIIDMLEKLQKKFDAEFHDAQDIATSTVDRNANSKDSDLVAVKNLDNQRKKLEPKFVEYKGTLDNQLYNDKELVDKLTEQVNDEVMQKDWCSTELSKNEKSHPILADDASNLKNLENPLMHFAVNEQSEKFTPHGSETTLLRQLDETSMPFNGKECNAMTIEINDKKFYIIFAQFKQQQKEMDRNIVETITVRTDQSKCKIVIRTLPENMAHAVL